MRSSSEASDCAICLDSKQGTIAVLSCGHTYHYKCVEEWVNKKKNPYRCCCICEKNTEIVNIICEGEDDYQKDINKCNTCESERNDNQQQISTQENSISLINNSERYYYDDSYFPNYSTRSEIYVNRTFSRNRVAPAPENQVIVRREVRPSFFDVLCCNIL